MGQGRFHGLTIEKTTLADLLRFVEDDYRANGRKSLSSVRSCASRLRAFYGQALAMDLTYDRLLQYVNARLAEKKTPRTVQSELSILKRGFNLARKAGRAVPPPFPSITISNARAGFFERDDFQAVLAHLPADLKPVATFAYLTGWRKTEMFLLQWAQVDFEAGIIRLEPGNTKNDEGRTFPFGVLPDLAALLRSQWNLTMEAQAETGTFIPWVLHHGMKRITDDYFYEHWREARRKAGLPNRILHDFRRTAVRNLERAGVPRSVAMKLTGHKTESVYRRYAIVNEADLSEGLKKLARLHGEDTAQSRYATVCRENPSIAAEARLC